MLLTALKRATAFSKLNDTKFWQREVNIHSEKSNLVSTDSHQNTTMGGKGSADELTGFDWRNPRPRYRDKSCPEIKR